MFELEKPFIFGRTCNGWGGDKALASMHPISCPMQVPESFWKEAARKEDQTLQAWFVPKSP